MQLGRYALAAFPVLLAAVVQAQQLPVFRAGVELLEVDVSVIDDAGEPVRDLAASEFAVSVDGDPRRIVAAQFIDLRPAADAAGRTRNRAPLPSFSYTANTGSAASGRGRLIILAIDRGSISFGEGQRVMRTAGDFLDTLGPNDQVALATVPPPGPAVDFTADHRIVREHLETISGMGDGPLQSTFSLTGFGDSLGLTEAEQIVAGGPLAARIVERLCGLEDMGCAQLIGQEAMFIVQDSQRQSKQSVWALEGLLRRVREIDGRKFIVWISESLISDYGSELLRVRRLAAEAQTSVHVILLEPPSLNAARNLSALPSPLAQRQDRVRQELGLQLMADYTGGSVYRAISDGEHAFERIGREMSGYYLLGVEPLEDDLDGRQHDIEVSVSREGVRVRARREVVHRAEDEEETVQERLERLLTSPLAVPNLPLRVATYVYQEEEGSDKVRVLVATDVERDPADPEVTFGYRLVAPDGKTLASRAMGARAAQGGSVVEQFAAFIVEPGQYRLMLAAVEDGGRHGSLTHRFDACRMADVPFAMGDLMLTAGQADDAIASRPQVVPRLTTGHLRTYLELYADDPAGLERLRVRTDVARTPDGAPLFSVTNDLAAIDGATTGTVSTVLRVDAFPPGSYVARVAVTRAGAVVGRRWRSFGIEHAPAALKGFAWNHPLSAPGAAAPETAAAAAPPETGCRLLQ